MTHQTDNLLKEIFHETLSFTDGEWHVPADALAISQLIDSRETILSPSQNVKKEIVFVFDNAPQYEKIVAAIDSSKTIHVLKSTEDGLRQIADILKEEGGVDALHIISHGASGQLNLGSYTLNAGQLDQQKETLSQISKSLNAGADILLYGCDVAQGETGKKFTQSLAKLTHADVAASDDLTGSAERGGNWNLEFKTGSVDAHSLFADVAPVIEGVLAGTVYTATRTSDGVQLQSTLLNRVFYMTDQEMDVMSEGDYFFGGLRVSIQPNSNETFNPESLEIKFFQDTCNSEIVLFYKDSSTSTLSLTKTNSETATINLGSYKNVSSIWVRGKNNMNMDVGIKALTVENPAPTLTEDYGTTIKSFKFEVDSGISQTDFLTNSSQPKIIINTDKILESSDVIQISTNSGTDWVNVSYNSIGDMSYSFSTSLTGGGNFELRIKNGNQVSKKVSHSYEIDTFAPSKPTVAIMDTATDDGASSTDGITTNTFAKIKFAASAGNSIKVYVDGAFVTEIAESPVVPTYVPAQAWSVGVHKVQYSYVDKAGNESEKSNEYSFTIQSDKPSVSSVTQFSGNGSFNAGKEIQVAVVFDKDIDLDISGGSPSLTLKTDTGTVNAEYVGLNGKQLIFKYVVQSGDNAADLNYASTSALNANGAKITAKGSPDKVAILNLPAIDSLTSLAGSSAIVFDTIAPAKPQPIQITPNTDSGVKGDGVTSERDAYVTLATEAKGKATLYDGQIKIGTYNTVGNSISVFNPSGWTQGVHALTYTIEDAAGNVSEASDVFNLTVVSQAPTVSSITYNAKTGVISINGSGFVGNPAGDDVILSKIWYSQTNVQKYFKTTSNVEIISSNLVEITLTKADKLAFEGYMTINGTASHRGYKYQLSLDDGWLAGVKDTWNLEKENITVTVSNLPQLIGAKVDLKAGKVTFTTDSFDLNAEKINIDRLEIGANFTPASSADTFYLRFNRNTDKFNIVGANTFEIELSKNTLNVARKIFGNVDAIESGSGNITATPIRKFFGGGYGWVENYGGNNDFYRPYPNSMSLNVENLVLPQVDSVNFDQKAKKITLKGKYFLYDKALKPELNFSKIIFSDVQNTSFTLSPTSVTQVDEETIELNLSDNDLTSLKNSLSLNSTLSASNLNEVKFSDGWNYTISKQSNKAMTVQFANPTIESVIQTSGDKYYIEGGEIKFAVKFSDNIQVDTTNGKPTVELKLQNGNVIAQFDSVSGNSIIFKYTVAAGDNTIDLEYAATDAFHANGAKIFASGSTDLVADLTLPGLNTTKSLGALSAVKIDTLAPSQPTITGLDAISDSGSSNTDNVTSVKKVSLTGKAELLSKVQLFNGTQLLASANTDTKGNWKFALTTDLSEGENQLTVVATDAAGNKSIMSNALTVTLDTTAPTQTISKFEISSDTGSSNKDLITKTPSQDYSVQLSAPLLAGEVIEAKVGNGTWVKANTVSDLGYATWTSQTFVEGSNSVAFRITDLAGNVSQLSNQSLTVDTKAPEASITLLSKNFNLGNSDQIQFTFDQAIPELKSEHIVCDQGTITEIKTVDGGKAWTAKFTPNANLEANAKITLKLTEVADFAGNKGASNIESESFVIDTIAPKATITSDLSQLKFNQSATITIKLSESVGDLKAELFNVEGGTLSNFNADSSKTTWTATFTPDANSDFKLAKITLKGTAIKDARGNAGSADAELNLVLDTRLPTVTIEHAGTTVTAGKTSDVKLTFSENVSFDATQALSVTGGQLSNFTTSDNGKTYTGTFTPNTDYRGSDERVTVNLASVKDMLGNVGTGTTTSQPIKVDTKLPTSTIKVLSADTALTQIQNALVEVTFSEAVTGLDATDFSNENLQVTDISTKDGVHWLATVTAAKNIEASAVALSLNNAGVKTLVGNVGASVTKQNFAVDTKNPSIQITSDKTALNKGGQATINFTLSEASNTFDAQDIVVSGGTLSNFKGSGTSYSATLTPLDNSTAPITLSIKSGSFTDLLGNAGSNAETLTINVDTVAPTTVATAIALEVDSGVSQLDYLTNKAQQVITGQLSATLGPDEKVEVSLDHGVTWQQANAVSGNKFFTAAINLVSGAQELVARVVDQAGNKGATFSQKYTLDREISPVMFKSFSFSNDNGQYTDDLITSNSSQVFSGRLDLSLNADEFVQISTDGLVWTDATLNDARNAWSLSVTLEKGAHPLFARIIDNAGNASNFSVANYSLVDAATINAYTDNDRDGVSQETELKVTSLDGKTTGDGNGDGILDAVQNNVSSLIWNNNLSQNYFVTLETQSEFSIANVETVPNESAEAVLFAAPTPFPKPSQPFGYLKATVKDIKTKGPITLNLYSDKLEPVNGFWVKGKDGDWYNLAKSVTEVNNKIKVTIELNDSAYYDLDKSVNGTIKFNGSLGYKNVPAKINYTADRDGDFIPDYIEAKVGRHVEIRDNNVAARDDLFVMQLYRDILFRESDDAGLTYWLNEMSHGMKRETVASNFLLQKEFNDDIGAIARLYFGTFNRVPDADGLKYWINEHRDGMKLNTISASFAASAEFQRTYGDVSNAAFVDLLYGNILHRPADAAGKTYWLDQMNAGMTRGNVLVNFTESNEFKKANADKVAITLEYLGLLGHAPDPVVFQQLLDQNVDAATLIGQILNGSDYLARFA